MQIPELSGHLPTTVCKFFRTDELDRFMTGNVAATVARWA